MTCRAGRPSDGSFVFIEGDIPANTSMNSLFAANQFDSVSTLRLWPAYERRLKDPVLYSYVNLLGSLKLLSAVIDAHPGRGGCRISCTPAPPRFMAIRRDYLRRTRLVRRPLAQMPPVSAQQKCSLTHTTTCTGCI
jgi:hypothetical protein